MKQVVSVFVMAALAGPVIAARANELQPQGFTNADLNSGYACNLSGTLGAPRSWASRSSVRRATAPSARPL